MAADVDIVAIPTGLADLRTGLLYVGRPDATIQQIRASDGAVEATSSVPAHPLTVHGGVLVASTRSSDGGIAIVALERVGPDLVTVWERGLSVPDWARDLALEPADGARLQITARSEGPDAVRVTWEAHARYEGGAPPPAEVEAREHRDARGAERFMLADGATATLAGTDDGEPARLASVAPTGPDDRLMSYRLDGDRHTHSWTDGPAVHQLVVRAGRPGFALVRDDGSGPVETSLTDDPSADVAVSLDGSVVLVRQSPADPALWTTFAAATAEPSGSVRVSGELISAVSLTEALVTLARATTGSAEQAILEGFNAATRVRIWSHIVEERPIRSAPPLPQ